MSEHVCPLCGASANFFASTTDRLLRTTSKRFSLYRCNPCEILFISPLPTPEELATYYPTGYWWSEPQVPQERITFLRKRLESIYRRQVLRDHVHFVMRTLRSLKLGERPIWVLDIGCSGGTFLHELSRRGVAVKGLDFSEEAVRHAREVYGLDCAVGEVEQSPWPDQTFSVVTCFHVLEHLRHPRAFLRSVHRALAPGGRLVLQVPNIRSLQFRIFGARWYALDPPRHLLNFSDRAVIRTLEESGFEIIRQKRFSLRDDPAALVSSVFLGLDPLAQRGLQSRSPSNGGPSNATRLLKNFAYFFLSLLAIPLALCDSWSGRGATIMIEARKRSSPS
jgi:2-polyprenyl-3-methyl-5-hydroxy-6-metoxy-1,4-benzoquinol methylase